MSSDSMTRLELFTDYMLVTYKLLSKSLEGGQLLGSKKSNLEVFSIFMICIRF